MKEWLLGEGIVGKFIIFSAKGGYYGDELLNYFFHKQ